MEQNGEETGKKNPYRVVGIESKKPSVFNQGFFKSIINYLIELSFIPAELTLCCLRPNVIYTPIT